jgi:TPP-dependent indolepyruvate ferredoxin oxidoreductase alpha subunit
MGVELTEALTERLVGLRAETVLVVEHDDAVLEQRVADDRERRVVQVGEVDAGDLRSDGSRELADT